MVDLLALAHERGCEAGLADQLAANLDAGRLPDLTRLRAHFAPDPAHVPNVVVHLAPLATFVALVQLMDNFRVFEPIVGFSAEANASSLSWLIFNDLSGDSHLFGSAGATSVLPIAGAVSLLVPVLIRTWREFNRKVV